MVTMRWMLRMSQMRQHAFSSGTTGDPKAIVWSHLTAIKCAVDGYLHQDIRPGHVVVWPTNLGWMMGPWLIFASLLNRGTIGLYEDAPMGVEFGRFVQDAGANMLGVVPTIVKAWRASRCMEGLDWSSIHVFSSTGEASHPEDMFYLSSLAGIRPIIEYCGGTEIGGGYITSTVVEPNYPSAFTTPAAGLDFVLLNEEGRLADEGELFLIPPSVGLSDRLLNRDHFETYYAETPTLDDGTLLRRHGDHVRRLPAGVYVAGGRVDDTMNLGGIKVSSAEIERVCNGVEAVRETAAIAVAEDRGPDQLVVFAVLAQSRGEAELQADFNRSLKEHLSPLFKVSRVVVVDALPRTASNKVMRRLLRDRLGGKREG
jgi:acetyl-CoA synthetase